MRQLKLQMGEYQGEVAPDSVEELREDMLGAFLDMIAEVEDPEPAWSWRTGLFSDYFSGMKRKLDGDLVCVINELLYALDHCQPEKHPHQAVPILFAQLAMLRNAAHHLGDDRVKRQIIKIGTTAWFMF